MTVKDWYRERHYLHFDQPIGPKRAARIVTDPVRVASHSFSPFLNYQIITKKVRRDGGRLVPKVKPRPIAFASHLDSHIYAYYCALLTEPYEKQLEVDGLGGSVLAFRKLGKSNIEFALDAFQKIRAMGDCTAIGYDISGFFNNLDHALLKEAWCRLLGTSMLPPDHYAVFKSLTKFAQVERKAVYKALGISEHNPPSELRRVCTPKEFREIVRKSRLINANTDPYGIPQGSPISAFLSNIYMLEFDRYMAKVVDEQGGVYFRYCDDMLFIVPTEFGKSLSGLVVPEIAKLQLKINDDKTDICEFRMRGGFQTTKKPLQYLGFLFDGQRILLRSAGLARYSERMGRGVRRAKKDRLKFNQVRVINGLPTKPLFKRKLYENYSHLGGRNFVRYGLRAAKTMQSKAIRQQLKPLWQRLNYLIDKA